MLKYHELGEGSTAPDFTLPAVDGQTVSLGDGLQRGARILLVFLRHLG
jgi:peroxiredoxin